jgi:hypothetical protein
MRIRARIALSLVVAGVACSHPIDPGTANLRGTVAAIDAQASRLGVSTGQIQCIAAPCFDYTVHVTGKVFEEQDNGEFRQITFAGIPNGAKVLVWTTGTEKRSYPAQVEARQVVVRYVDLQTRKVRSLR